MALSRQGYIEMFYKILKNILELHIQSAESVLQSPLDLVNWAISSIGMGNTMVLFFSEEMVARVCRYLSWRAAGLSEMMSLASFKALLAFCSPSAAITLALASLEASASAAMALCRF